MKMNEFKDYDQIRGEFHNAVVSGRIDKVKATELLTAGMKLARPLPPEPQSEEQEEEVVRVVDSGNMTESKEGLASDE
jgi:hypothetical protein